MRKRRRRRISFCTYIEVGGGGRREGWSTPRDEESKKSTSRQREREQEGEKERSNGTVCVFCVSE